METIQKREAWNKWHEILDRKIALLHRELDGFYRIRQIERVVFGLIRFDQRYQDIQPIADDRSGWKVVVTSMAQRRLISARCRALVRSRQEEIVATRLPQP